MLLAGLAGAGWSHLWPGTPAGSYALIGGAALLAAAMQGPLSAVVLALELTRHTDALMVPTLLAVTEATILARRMGAPSIYSARLGLDGASGRGETAASRSLRALDDLPASAPEPAAAGSPQPPDRAGD